MPAPGLVSGPEPVAKRLDDVIGRDADVRRAAVDHAEDGGDHAADGGHFPAVGVARRRERVVVAEQLVGAVDEINVQLGSRHVYRPRPSRLASRLQVGAPAIGQLARIRATIQTVRP